MKGPVHPRVCGEHIPATKIVTGVMRSIPACAGNTFRHGKKRDCDYGPSPRVRGTHEIETGSDGRFTVHPRVCGEHIGTWPVTVCIYGPSPRVRGTPPCGGLAMPTSAVHPRVCGEHPQHGIPPGALARSIPACAGNTRSMSLARLNMAGPSPRVRGTRQSHRPRHRRTRSIPACAGNTYRP